MSSIGRRFVLTSPDRVVADGVCWGDVSVVHSRTSSGVTVYRHGARYLPAGMLRSLYWIDDPMREPYEHSA